jgi:hypothetical protein
VWLEDDVEDDAWRDIGVVLISWRSYWGRIGFEGGKMREIKELCILSCLCPGPFSIAGKPVIAAPVTLLYQEVINVRRSSRFRQAGVHGS